MRRSVRTLICLRAVSVRLRSSRTLKIGETRFSIDMKVLTDLKRSCSQSRFPNAPRPVSAAAGAPEPPSSWPSCKSWPSCFRHLNALRGTGPRTTVQRRRALRGTGPRPTGTGEAFFFVARREGQNTIHPTVARGPVPRDLHRHLNACEGQALALRFSGGEPCEGQALALRFSGGEPCEGQALARWAAPGRCRSRSPDLDPFVIRRSQTTGVHLRLGEHKL